ncbi:MULTISPECIES: DUF924 family protein [unclassified Meridianimarinicoccus]|uniref:DUF924 family protein n=1 Tax=unclassified Meridianimarinicoccus TaxID=2923344 RepID=UPI001868B39B|nr:DUF924 family protein [Fluviibacterium sp. MJW13]
MTREAAPAEEILRFWTEETSPEGWYRQSDDLDAEIRKRWESMWTEVRKHGWPGWTPTPRSTLAFLILTDQFPRNMFRNDGRAFATDELARARAKCAIEKNWDLKIDGAARQFFYLPLCHSECLVDQDRAVRLFNTRMPDAAENLVHARAHREVIRRFGRFPHRNTDLGRASTLVEQSFLKSGGYGSVVDSLKASA